MIKINKALKLGGNSRRVSSFNRCLMEHLLEIIASSTQMKLSISLNQDSFNGVSGVLGS